ncbi:DMT family transporter [Caldisericum exile]|uniref:DMT family transporter n=1 Tax=Caldisericum exile TaxID=693075 RepID=UPI003C708A0A
MEKKTGLWVNLSLFLLFLVWANSYTFIKIAERQLEPISLVIARFFIIFPFLFLFKDFYTGIKKIQSINDFLKILLVGLLIVPAYHIFLNTAETMINASVAALVAGFSPVITGVLSSIILREKLEQKRIIGLIISLVGVITLTYGISHKFEIKNSFGVLLSLTSVTSWALATVTSKSLYNKFKPIEVNTLGLFFGTLALIPFVKTRYIKQILTMNSQTLIAVLYLGVLCILIGYAVWFKALEYKEASTTATFIYLNPIIGSISGIIFLKEPMNIVMIIGGITIILGLFFVNPLKMEIKRQESFENK